MANRALILAGGAGPHRRQLDAAWPGWDASIDLVVAADAGALLAAPLGLHLDLLVGDFDSLGAETVATFEANGVSVERSPADKDASDTELALLAAVERGATNLVVLGAFGGRFDHALANVWILAHPGLRGRSVALLDDETRVRLLTSAEGSPSGSPARLDLDWRTGDLVTLLPLNGPATGVSTGGLRWPLTDACLPVGVSLGLSNELLPAAEGPAWVAVGDGRLLVIETTLIRSEL